MSNLPSHTLLQVISTDYLAQNFFVMIFVGWAFYIIDPLFSGKTSTFLLIFALILTPIGLLTFFWRYNLICSTIVNGMEVTGNITEIETISTNRRREYRILHYEYNINGQAYQYKNRVKKNAYASKLKIGQQVILLAHKKTPHIASIKDVYLEYL
ncbi:MAG: hypothetical protein FJ031_14505 [Chloroflexi bacterium]|nr:hypothetical protein [Chloroflexota bacterium]